MDKVRCIEIKTGRVFSLSKSVAQNAQYMRKYGYRVEDAKADLPDLSHANLVDANEFMDLIEAPELQESEVKPKRQSKPRQQARREAKK